MGSQGKKKDRSTERGEIMQYFMQKLNAGRARDGMPPLTMGRMGRLLVGIPTQDLYFLKSVCDDASKRGDMTSFSKKFWWEINPKNHTEEAKAKRAKIEATTKKKYSKKKKPIEQDYDA
jgi:hypothetical protein